MELVAAAATMLIGQVASSLGKEIFQAVRNRLFPPAPGIVLTTDQQRLLREIITYVAQQGLAATTSPDLLNAIIDKAVDTVTKNPAELLPAIKGSSGIREEDDTLQATGELATIFRATKRPIQLPQWMKDNLGSLVIQIAAGAVVAGGVGGYTIASQQTQAAIILVVTGDDVNLRVFPSTEAAVIGQLDSGTQLTKVADEGDWVFVHLVDTQTPTNNKSGWVHRKYLQQRP